jgi:hypothetical protein
MRVRLTIARVEVEAALLRSGDRHRFDAQLRAALEHALVDIGCSQLVLARASAAMPRARIELGPAAGRPDLAVALGGALGHWICHDPGTAPQDASRGSARSGPTASGRPDSGNVAGARTGTQR